MTDIVERLRDGNASGVMITSDAADEIERLRKALQSIRDLEESPEEEYMDPFDVGWNAALVIPRAIAYEVLNPGNTTSYEG